ncbi:hypothetical protein [uncultured Fibrella sp.]|uniref:hypothetical protein n=1 Tax=uncultured Fibrella sp. TaxID=1284596 RepID=UPI0035C98259
MKTTKHVLTNIQRVIVLSLLIGSGSRCTHREVDRQAEGPCRIRLIEAKDTVLQNNQTPDDNTDQTVYEYDELGRISHIVQHYDKRFKGQSASIYSYVQRDDYTYDNAGFLISLSSASQWTPTNGALSNNTNTTLYTYTYTNGRLTQQLRQQTNEYGLQTKTVSTYTYDTAGSLITRAEATTYPVIPTTLQERPLFPDGMTSEWTYKNGKAVDYVERQGGIEVHPYVFQNGLFQTQTGPNYRTVFTYDTQNRLVKSEFWVDGKLTSYSESTYLQAKLPPGEVPNHFKGFPDINDPKGEEGVPNTYSFYLVLNTGTIETSRSQLQYKLTGAGYVASSEQVLTPPANGSSPQLMTKTTYTYDGSCD